MLPSTKSILECVRHFKRNPIHFIYHLHITLLLNKQWTKEEIRREVKKKNLQTNKNGNTKYLNMGYSKSDSHREVIMTNAYIKKKETWAVNSLSLSLKKLEKIITNET